MPTASAACAPRKVQPATRPTCSTGWAAIFWSGWSCRWVSLKRTMCGKLPGTSGWSAPTRRIPWRSALSLTVTMRALSVPGGCSPRQGVSSARTAEDLGPHLGVDHYTVGQRKGLGIAAGRPLFVRTILENGDIQLAESGGEFQYPRHCGQCGNPGRQAAG